MVSSDGHPVATSQVSNQVSPIERGRRGSPDSPGEPDEPDDVFDLSFTDEELTAFALAADRDQSIPDDAVPFRIDRASFGDLLPDWYMPAPGSYRGGRIRAMVGAVVILSLVLVNAVGLCVTYGQLAVAW